MRRKSIGKRRHSSTPSATTPSISPIPLLSTAQLPDSIPEFETVDSLDDGICISCNQCDGALLICTGTDCPVSVHVSCIGSQPKFDDSGNFYCPYCWYKRTFNNTKQLKQKALIAKQALASFLDDNQTVRKDASVEEPVVEPVQEPVNNDELRVSDSEEKERKEHEDDDDDKGYVSATGSSVSETNDSDYKASISVKKGNVNRRVRSCVKKSLLREQNSGGGGGGGGGGDVDEEEVTSSRSRLSKQRVEKQISLTGGGKRKPLFWTPEEEKALEEGVLKFAKENQNIPWRKILEFGCRVFDKTRTPVDLKDKWKKMSSMKVHKARNDGN